MREKHWVGFAIVVLVALVSSSVLAADNPPDLTRGETKGVDRKSTYNLGSTGLRGWMYTHPAEYLDSVQGRTTAAARQILVTHVGAKSPADGIIQVNDVILGAGGKLFSDDARKSMGWAIQEAEKEANGGILKLTRWRAGKTEEVQLKLRVLGTYSDTAPYDCPKSKHIFDDACKALAKEPLNEDWCGEVNGLALLASGNPEYLPRLRDFAHKLVLPAQKMDRGALGTWETGYRTIFLSEYYLLTGDKAVLPGINAYTIALAKGQGMYGTFGHGFADLTADGKFHGSVPPYGPVNAAGLVGNLAIVMGKKCGVNDPEVDPAIERASRFFGYFVDKGGIPYGEHEPWPYHENNGKNSMTALLFSLQGNKVPQAQFFAKMCTAAYANREYGHTGQGFSYLWTTLGANAGGPEAAAAYVKQASWHLDLVRRCDGAFTYDGGEQYGAGSTDDNTYYGNSNYCGLSPTASYVLAYSIPLKKLCITGKDANPANLLSKKDVAEAIASGRFDLDRKKMSTKELVAAFGDWSPIVRGWAAEELARRPEARTMVPELMAMAEGKDAHVRQGACEALGCIRSTEALPVLVRLLSHEDRWLRFKAAQAIKNIGGAAKPSIPDILKAVARTAEPLEPIAWADPIQLAHGQLAHALFDGPMTDSVKQADPKLVYPAIRAVATNADGMARMHLRGYFESRLTLEDAQALAADLFTAVKTPSPADLMFANEIRMGAMKALVKYRFNEGIDACIILTKFQGGHGSESRTGEIMKDLVAYGAAAKRVIPQLNELVVMFNDEVKNGHFPGGELNDRRVNAIKDAIKTIEAATTQPELRSIAK